MYFLLNAKASRVLQNEVQNGGGTKRWGTKYFKHSSNLKNTMVVPYLDKDHWYLYIHEEKQCIHYDSIPRFHNDAASREFACYVCIAWSLSRGLNEDDSKLCNFATFVNVNSIIPKVFAQKNSWECGHQVVLNFKTYLQE